MQKAYNLVNALKSLFNESVANTSIILFNINQQFLRMDIFYAIQSLNDIKLYSAFSIFLVEYNNYTYSWRLKG
jgi:hypothetical protein